MQLDKACVFHVIWQLMIQNNTLEMYSLSFEFLRLHVFLKKKILLEESLQLCCTGCHNQRNTMVPLCL